MKTKLILLFGIIAVFSSCSSAYRIGQTPDDVYYSPAPPQDEYVTSDNQQDKDTYANNNSNNIEDLAIRRGINDPSFRNNISLNLGSGYYPYDSYGSSFYNPYNSYYNPYGYTGVTFYPYNNYYNNFYSPYNNYYSPYYNSYYPPLYYITKPGVPASNYNGPRQYNLGAYNVNTNRTAPVTTSTTTTSSVPVRTFKPQPNTSGVGNFVRRIFTPSNNNSSSNNNRNNSNNNNYNNNNNNTAPARTFQPGTSSGNNNSSSSGSSSGSAPVRTFRH